MAFADPRTNGSPACPLIPMGEGSKKPSVFISTNRVAFHSLLQKFL